MMMIEMNCLFFRLLLHDFVEVCRVKHFFCIDLTFFYRNI